MKIRSMLMMFVATQSLLACGPVDDTGAEPGTEDIDEAESELTAANVTDAAYSAYTAVGLLDLSGPKCTGTLIDEQHVLTTHGCMSQSLMAADTDNDDPRNAFVLSIPDASGRIQQTRLPIRRWHGFWTAGSGDISDVAVVRLANRAVVVTNGGVEEPIAAPIPLASTAPSSPNGPVKARNTLGFGGGLPGVKRMVTWSGAWSTSFDSTYGNAVTVPSSLVALGQGDSGGPTFNGNALEALSLVTESDTRFADPVSLKPGIDQYISSWGGANGAPHKYTSFVPLVVRDNTPAGTTSALETGFETVITVTNTDTKAADLSIEFTWDQGATNAVGPAAPSNPGGTYGTFLYNGLAPKASHTFSTTSFPAGFEGSAVIRSNRHITASVAYLPKNATSVVNVPRATAIPAGDADHTVYLPSVLKKTFEESSVIAVQNAYKDPVDVEISLKCADGSCGAGATIPILGLPAYTTHIINLHNLASLSGFNQINAAATITASLGNQPAKRTPIAAFVLDAGYPGSPRPYRAAMYEGIDGVKLRGSRGEKVYLATALCDAFGLRTYQAMMNASSKSQSLLIDYLTLAGSVQDTDASSMLPPFTKASFDTCAPEYVVAGFSGTAMGYAVHPLTAIAKASSQAAGAVVGTAFRGEHEGSTRLSFPEVYWQGGAGGFDTYFALQNVGKSPTNLRVTYYDQFGVVKKTENLAPIAAGAKMSVAANVSAGFSGSALVEVVKDPSDNDPTDRIAGIARISRTDAAIPSTEQKLIEDYNGIPLNEETLVGPPVPNNSPGLNKPSSPTCPACFP